MPAAGGSPNITIEPLAARHKRGAFCCGNEFIDSWCKTTAHKDHEKYKSRVFVATANGHDDVIGIYNLTIRSLAPKRIVDIGFGRRDIPAIYFATLGVCNGSKGAGIGTALMVDAFKRTIKVSEDVGTYCLWLTAVDQPTAKFYAARQFQFIEPGKNLDMYAPLQTLRDAFK